VNRDQKAAVIDEIAADISKAQAIFAVDYRGITVAQAEALRQRLHEADASFRVVKNSLTERAADQAGAEHLRPLLEGPTALTFVRGDSAAAAKAVADFARTTQLLAFKGGVMDGAALSSADVAAISRLPSRDVLYGQLVGLVATPITQLARTLNALVGGLAIALNELRAKKESGEVQSGTSAATAAAEAGGVPSAGADEPPAATAAAQTGQASAEVDGAAGAEAVEASDEGDGAAAARGVEEAPGEADASGAADEGDGVAAAGGVEEAPGEADASGAADEGDGAAVAGGAEDAVEADAARAADEAVAAVEAPGAEEAPEEDAAPHGDPLAEEALQTEDGSAPAASGDDDKEDQ
jgi:large subunit ribosomal protein L10